MYRINLSETREADWTITATDPEHGKVKIKIRYLLLDRDQIAERILGGLGDDSESDVGRFEALRRTLSREEMERRDIERAGRIVDWDLGNEAGEKLPCTMPNKLAVLKIPFLFEPIDKGIFDASRGGQRKN